jgi:hypothetical protein
MVGQCGCRQFHVSLRFGPGSKSLWPKDKNPSFFQGIIQAKQVSFFVGLKDNGKMQSITRWHEPSTEHRKKSSIMETTVARWGYLLLSPSHPASPGSPGLIVTIRSRPTAAHYDPETLCVRLVTPDGLERSVDLTQTTPVATPERVVIGKLSLRDRVDKRVDFFSFGATLEQTVAAHETVYALTSPAPILELSDRTDEIPDLLAAEVEALIAGCQALWGRNWEGYVRRRNQLDPLQLYISCLKSIFRLYREVRFFRNEHPEFYSMLLMEKELLIHEKSWTSNIPELESLLCPE